MRLGVTTLLLLAIGTLAEPEYYTEQQHIKKADGSERIVTVRKRKPRRESVTIKTHEEEKKPKKVVKTTTVTTRTPIKKVTKPVSRIQNARITGTPRPRAVEPTTTAAPKKEGWYKWWKGLLIALGVLAFIGILGGLWAYGHKRRHATVATTRVTTTTRGSRDLEAGLGTTTHTTTRPVEVIETTTTTVEPTTLGTQDKASDSVGAKYHMRY